MTQIKLFTDRTPDLEAFEKKVNTFLEENKDKFIVKDIKYTAESPNSNNSAWKNWTAMVVYEVKY